MSAAASPSTDNPIALAQALIRCPSVTPEDGGALGVLETALAEHGFAVNRPIHREPVLRERSFEHAKRAAVLGRDARAADQRLCEGDRVVRRGGCGGAHVRSRTQSRSSSLIEVFERVCASTRLTITAQYRLGPGLPSGSGLPGRLPGTTTE